MASRAATAPARALVVSEIRAHQLGEVSEHDPRSANCAAAAIFAFASRAAGRSLHPRRIAAAQAVAQVDCSPATPSTTRRRSIRGCRRSSESNIYNTINHLQGYQNRYYASSHRQDRRPNGSARTGRAWRAAAATSPPNCSPPAATCSTQPSVILTVQGSRVAGRGRGARRAPGFDQRPTAAAAPPSARRAPTMTLPASPR